MTRACSAKTTRRGVIATAMAGVLALSVAGSAPPVAHAQSDQGISLIRDTEIEEIIRNDATPVWKAAGLDPKAIHIYLVNDNELNAMVAGGQNIFINTGLIMKTETPNQLIGVIAHETGHIANGDLARAGEGSRGAVATQLITLGLGLAAAIASPDSGAAIGILSSANYFATMQMFTYTRVQEATADQAGARFLEEAGISGRGLVEFFDNFRYEEVFSDARREPYFRNHPLSSQRIDSLRTRVMAAPHYDVVDSPEALEQHAVMVAKLKGFINYPQQTYQDYPETDTSFPARYARAIADYKDLQTEKALGEIDALLADYPDNPYLWELKGQVLFETGRVKEAEAPQRKAVEIKPDAALLRVSLAQTLIANGGPDRLNESIDNLKRSLILEADDPFAWRLMSEAYERIDQPGMARLAAAEQNFAQGQMGDAREMGMRALEYFQQDTPQYRRARDIINAAEVSVQGRRRGG